MADTGCYSCIHLNVCKYFKGIPPYFPFKSDDEIGPFLNTLSSSMKKACAFYAPRIDDTEKGG